MRAGLGQLRLSAEAFWALSLPEFLLAMDGYKDAQDQAYYRTGTLVAAIYNVNRDTRKHGALSASDIFPFLPKPTRTSMSGAVWSDEAYTEDDEEAGD